MSETNVILGGPGAGETTRLLKIIEEALESGVKPNKIGFMSFSKKAAEEGKTRACQKFGMSEEDFTHFRTIHSMAFRHLSMKRDQMVSWSHYHELGKMLGIEFKGRGEVAEDDVYGMATADRMLFLEGLARNTKKGLKLTWEEAFEDAIDWFELERFGRAFTAFKWNRKLSDFNDLVERFAAVHPDTLPTFDLLLIDEAQDCSPIQWDIVKKLESRSRITYIVGDDLQAIYRWSGADVDQFINYPGAQINLEQSYRVPSAIHKLADSLSDRVANKRPRIWKPREEIGAVNWFSSIEEVDLSQGTWLLLARNGYMLDEMEEYCYSQGFSFNSVSRDPLKSPALAAVKTWENLRRNREESSEHIVDMLKFMEPGSLPAAFVKRLKSDEAKRGFSMEELMAAGLKTNAIWHEALTRISPKERDFFIAARKRGEPLLKEPRIKISTIHAAKGGEADNVLLMTDISFRCYQNMQSNMDDEIRVWYVACTRAKKTLNLIIPRTNLNFEL